MEPLVPGQVVLRQEVVDGQVWFEHPVTVLDDSDGVLAVRLDDGSPFTFPDHPRGPHPWSPFAHWSGATVLQVRRDDDLYAVWKFFDLDGTFRHWYINFEAPLKRGSGCYEMHDYGLDLVVDPDGTRRWKDVEDLHRIRTTGRIDLATVGAVLAAAAEVIHLLDTDQRWWSSWDHWTP